MLPVLVLWANVHGSVLLGIAVCVACLAVRALGSVRGRAWRLAAADAGVSFLAFATLFATPYGTAMPAYYARVLEDAAERLRVVPEASIKELEEVGFFRLLQPQRFDGLEADPVTFYTAVRDIASACGSTGKP